jgi:hypothetical protein
MNPKKKARKTTERKKQKGESEKQQLSDVASGAWTPSIKDG